MRRLALVPLIAPSLALLACSPTQTAAPVVGAQREAAARLAARTAEDADALRAATEALLAVRRTAVQRDLELEIARRYLDAAGEPNRERLADDLARDAGPLADLGPDAETWLADYADALAARDGDRINSLLARHPALESFDEDARRLLAALDDRAATTGALASDLVASSESLALLFDPQAPPPADLLLAFYEQALADRIDDPAKRAAAARIARRIAELADTETDQ